MKNRRRAVLSWIPTAIVALICLAVVAGAIAMQNSWWVEESPVPSDDQQAPDGMSLFGGPGVDFLTRDGAVRVKLRADALPATKLGLDAEGVKVIDPIVPIDAVVLGADGAFTLDLVGSISITTAGDQVRSITLVQDGPGSWLSISAQLARIAPAWGWTSEQLEQLEVDLTSASRSSDGDSYSASLPAVEHKGALSTAEITIDQAASSVGLAFTIERLP